MLLCNNSEGKNSRAMTLKFLGHQALSIFRHHSIGYRTNSKYKIYAILAIILTSIMWGYSFVSTKIVLRQLPPISIAFFRQVLAALVMLIFLYIKKLYVKMAFKDILLLAVSSFFGVVLYFLFENNALMNTTASNASIIVAAVPIFTMVTEYFLFKVKISAKLASCVLVSIAGVVLVIFEEGSIDFSSKSLRGNLLMLGAMICWVIYTILCKGLINRYNGMALTTYQMIASSVLFIPFIIPEIPQWQPISANSVGNLIYLTIFCSALGYYLYNIAVKWLGTTITSMFLNLIPVVTIIGGVLVLNEKVSLLQLGGMLLIILSLLIVNWNRSQKSR